MNNGSVILFFWLCLFPGVATPPQSSVKRSAPPAEPSVDQILDNYEKAIGGKQAWLNVTSRVSAGTIETPESGASGTYETYELGSNKIYSIERLATGKEVIVAFNGTVGWTINPQSGNRKLDRQELADAKRRAQFPEEIKIREFFSQLHFMGKTSLAGRDTYLIEAVPQEGTPWMMYFDARTWLRVRIDGTLHFALQSEPAQGYFEDYREVGNSGMKYPFRVTLKTSHATLVKRVERVQLNVAVDQSLFTPPSFKFKIQQ